MNNKSCDENCQLFRWHKCSSKRDDGRCDQPKRYDNALNEWDELQCIHCRTPFTESDFDTNCIKCGYKLIRGEYSKKTCDNMEQMEITSNMLKRDRDRGKGYTREI